MNFMKTTAKCDLDDIHIAAIIKAPNIRLISWLLAGVVLHTIIRCVQSTISTAPVNSQLSASSISTNATAVPPGRKVSARKVPAPQVSPAIEALSDWNDADVADAKTFIHKYVGVLMELVAPRNTDSQLASAAAPFLTTIMSNDSQNGLGGPIIQELWEAAFNSSSNPSQVGETEGEQAGLLANLRVFAHRCLELDSIVRVTPPPPPPQHSTSSYLTRPTYTTAQCK